MAKKKKKTTSFAHVKPDVILGLDMSLETPGWARYTIAEDKLESSWIDVKSRKIDGIHRLRFIRDCILELAEVSGKSVYAFIEGYAFAAKGRSGISLAELGGAIRMGLHDLNVGFFEVPPASLKKFILGKGVGDKSVMLKDLYKRYGHDINQNDEGDAVALVELGKAVTGNSKKPLAKFQEEVLSNL